MSKQFVSRLRLPEGVFVGEVREGSRLWDYIICMGRLDSKDLDVDLGVDVDLDATAKQDLTVFLVQPSNLKLVAKCWSYNASFCVSLSDLTVYPKPGFVYLIHATGSNRYKIGYSNDPLRRLQELQGLQPSQSPFDLELIAVSPLVCDVKVLESSWHQILADFRAKGEWFDLPEDLAKTIAFNLIHGGTPSLSVMPSIRGWDWDLISGISSYELTENIEKVSCFKRFLESRCGRDWFNQLGQDIRSA